MSKVCEVCGEPLESLRKKKYCSRSCKNTGGSRRYHATHNGSLEYCLKKLCGEKRRKDLYWHDVYDLYLKQEGKCAVTGIQMTFDRSRKQTALSLDRIEAGGPYIIENIRLVCSVVNSMRLDMTDKELLFWCKKILENADC